MTYRIDFTPIGYQASCAEEATIMEVARSAGIALTSVCGGRTTCGRCRVRVISGKTSALSDNERARLSEEEVAAGFRLACATRILGDLKLEIPATSLPGVQRLQLFGQEPELLPDPVISVYELKLPASSPDTPQAEWENLLINLKARYGLENLQPDLSVLPDMPVILRTYDREVAVLVREDEVIAVRPPGRELLGIAFDLGTTTIAAYLVNLRSGENLAVQGAMNPQIAHGEDVMSRISYAMAGGADELRKSLLGTLNHLIQEMANEPEEIAEVTIAGNTAMHHLVLGLPVKQLGMAPYLPTMCHPLDIKARELGLQVSRGAYVHFLPNIAGFVGADHVAVLLVTRIYEADKTIIGIDIGTNTEVTLAARDTLTSLSCASGPAFEGAGISHGMRAASGAIEKVKIDDGVVHLEVIGSARPTGICGSGILDIVSELRSSQIIDARGRLQEHRLVRQGNTGREFILAEANTTGTGQDIVVTQHDIGEIQLAKAAIRSGINILLADAGISEDKIDEMIVAGAFGRYLNPSSAISIGMFPPLSLNRLRQVGNATGVGAKLALVSKKERLATEQVARQVRYLELTAHPEFTREFSGQLRLP